MSRYPPNGAYARAHGHHPRGYGRGMPMPARSPHLAPISQEDGEKLTRDALTAELRRQGGINEPTFTSESYTGVTVSKKPYGDSSITSTNPIFTAHNENSPPGAPPIQSYGAASAGFEDTELYFDSSAADGVSNTGAGEISWTIASLNNLNDVKNCVAVKIGDFYFPKINGTAGFPEFFYYRRVFIELLSFPNIQGVLGAGGNRFHFECEVENINSQAVLLRPIRDVFYLRQPLNSLNTFQIRFLAPSSVPGSLQFKKIPIPASLVSATLVVASNPAQLTLADTSIIGAVGVPAVPIALVLTGGTSGDAAVDAIIYNTEGVFVTNINSTTVVTISTVVAGVITAINAAASTTAAIINASVLKNRFAISARFTSVIDKPANYITITHD